VRGVWRVTSPVARSPGISKLAFVELIEGVVNINFKEFFNFTLKIVTGEQFNLFTPIIGEKFNQFKKFKELKIPLNFLKFFKGFNNK
jgi:hypothetical protein